MNRPTFATMLARAFAERMPGVRENVHGAPGPRGRLRYVAEPGCEPSYGNGHAAGIDLRSAEPLELFPGVPKKARTGLRVEIPPGHVGLVRGRSGLAFKRGIWAFEGTIDEDYRGEIGLLLLNLSAVTRHIEPGERLTQLVIVPVARLTLESAEALTETGRGANGFGSTGAR